MEARSIKRWHRLRSMLTTDIAEDLTMNKPDVATKDALAGICRANTPALASKNAMLVIFGRREAEGKALETELCEFGMDAVFVRVGPTCDNEVHRYIDQAVGCIGHIDDAAGTPVHQRRF
jgi:hypothetical protein